MQLYHHSRRPVTGARDYEQPGSSPGHFGQAKPKGLWVSDDDDYGWHTWCRDENFALAPMRYRVYVRDEMILHLATPGDLLEFTKKYRVDIASLLGYGDDVLFENHYIDWPRVAGDYAGILITPYQWSLRLDLMWYYGWDCASGCIWDSSAIRRIRYLRGGEAYRRKRWSEVKNKNSWLRNERKRRSRMRRMRSFVDETVAGEVPNLTKDSLADAVAAINRGSNLVIQQSKIILDRYEWNEQFYPEG